MCAPQELGINSADALKDTISLIFDKACGSVAQRGLHRAAPRPADACVRLAQAIWEPTFCPLYAEMCVGLSKALPEFPPMEGEDKPLTFRRVLLNTCQARLAAPAPSVRYLQRSRGKQTGATAGGV